MAAGCDDIVVSAAEENDREAHLDIVEALMHGAPGVARNPAGALRLARAALLVKAGHDRLLERANRGAVG